MDIPTLLDLSTQRARDVLEGLMAPALMPLPHIPASAELWGGDRHVRLHGEAIYAEHRGTEAWWVVVVKESSTLAVGCVRLTPPVGDPLRVGVGQARGVTSARVRAPRR